MPPWAFGLGLAILLVSNLGVAALVVVDRVAPGAVPPINAFTDISNVAMERAVAAGEVPKPLATFWAQSYWAGLLSEYFDAGLPAADFVAQWCEAPDHYDVCIAAKEVAKGR